MRDAQFAAGAELAEFASDSRWAFRDVAAMLRRLRDWMIGREGVEKTDEVLPTWQIDGLVEAAAHSDMTGPQPAFAQAVPDEREAVLAAREAAVAARETQLLVQQQAEIDRGKAAKAAAAAEFASQLVDAGKLLPRHAGVVATLLTVLDEQPAAAFAMPDGEQQIEPAVALRDLLNAGPRLLDYAEKSAGDLVPATAAFAAPVGTYVDPARMETLARARAWMAEHPGSTLVDAVNAVSA